MKIHKIYLLVYSKLVLGTNFCSLNMESILICFHPLARSSIALWPNNLISFRSDMWVNTSANWWSIPSTLLCYLGLIQDLLQVMYEWTWWSILITFVTALSIEWLTLLFDFGVTIFESFTSVKLLIIAINPVCILDKSIVGLFVSICIILACHINLGHHCKVNQIKRLVHNRDSCKVSWVTRPVWLLVSLGVYGFTISWLMGVLVLLVLVMLYLGVVFCLSIACHFHMILCSFIAI